MADFSRLRELVRSSEGAWHECAHMSEDVREGWIRTAVHGREMTTGWRDIVVADVVVVIVELEVQG